MPERICLSRVSGSQLSLSIVGRVWSAAGQILGTQLPFPQHKEGRNPARRLLMTPFPWVTSPDSVRFHQPCSSGASPQLEDLLSQTFKLNPCVSAQSLQTCPTLPTLWPVAHQAALSMAFSRQEYWSGLPCSPPENLPNLGIKLACAWVSCIAVRFFMHWATWGAQLNPYEPTRHGGYSAGQHVVTLCLDGKRKHKGSLLPSSRGCNIAHPTHVMGKPDWMTLQIPKLGGGFCLSTHIPWRAAGWCEGVPGDEALVMSKNNGTKPLLLCTQQLGSLHEQRGPTPREPPSGRNSGKPQALFPAWDQMLRRVIGFWH